MFCKLAAIKKGLHAAGAVCVIYEILAPLSYGTLFVAFDGWMEITRAKCLFTFFA
jgi:hypothetical protein